MMTDKRYFRILVLSLCAFLVSPAFSFAQAARTYNYGHIRYAEGEVSLQRALSTEAGEAAINVPVMPGDRLWTAPNGRAEVLLADGSVLHMDTRTKVDFTAFGEGAGEETLLRLWSGSLIVRVVDSSAAALRVDTPSGSIFPVSQGLFRIDVDESGTATVSVLEGVAELASETGSVLVRTGQRSFVQPGLRPETPFEFNTALYDTFQSWSEGREQLSRRTVRIEGVPDEVAVYTSDLQYYGNWQYDPSYGRVWYPTVSVGWSPYTYGRWSYTSFGWTWISSEPWGWAPYHYGRWGYGTAGWYWVPGAYWGPAWVSWAFGPTWVGWSPLGYYDRAVIPYRSAFNYHGRGHGGGYSGRGWSFVNKDHFRSGPRVPVERTRLRVEDVRATANQGRLFESGAILDRELQPRAVGATAMTRASRSSRISNSTGAASSLSSGTNRGELRRGPRSTSVTGTNSSGASRGYAVPRLAPAGSTSRATATGETTGASGRGNSASPLGRASVGAQRGNTGTSESTDVPRGSSTSSNRSGRSGTSGGSRIMPGAIRRAPSSASSPSRIIGSSGNSSGAKRQDPGNAPASSPGSAGSPSSPGVTRGPAVERSKESSAGSKDFFGRRPPSVAPRSERTGSRATPRAQSGSSNNDRSSRATTRSSNRSSNTSGNTSGNKSGNNSRNSSSSSSSSNRNKNRGSSRPRN